MRFNRRPTLGIAGAAVALAVVALVASCGTTPSTSAGPNSTSTAGQGSPTGTSSPATSSSATAQPLRSGERFVNLKVPEPYTPKAPSGGTDEYRCFLVDPKLTAPAFLTGTQFLPQNAAIVHHAIFFRVAPDSVPKARAVDAQTPGEGWTCFGDDGVDDDPSWVGHWAPGVKETLLTSGVGYPMPAGSQIVMQVHYNLLATGGRPGASDQSGIRLRLTDGAAGFKPLQTQGVEAPVELPCPSGDSGPLCDRSAAIADVASRFGPQIGHAEDNRVRECDPGGSPVPGNTQHCDQPVREAATVYAVAGHMHLLGRSIKLELNPGTPGARTLLDVPVYNFDDQGIRPLATPVTVKPGDTLRVTCTHYATLRRQLPELHGLPPRYVVWGDGTSDEMCLGLLVVSPTT